MLRSLNLKINIAVALVLLVIMMASAYVSLKEEERRAIESTKAKAQLLTRTVANIVRRDMLSSHEKDIDKLIRIVSEFPDIETFRIFNTDGVILHSADPNEVLSDIDNVVVDVLKSGNHSLPFRTEEKGHLSFCRVEIIQNEKPCYRCHGSESDIVGVLEVCMSMQAADEQLDKSKTFLVFSTLGTIMLVGVAVSVVTAILIKRPSSALENVMNKVQDGNLDVRADAYQTDEFGRLGKAFNDMIAQLDASNNEIKKLHDEQIKRSERLASIGEMAASVAHEIKNPLAGLSGAAQILALSFSPDDPRIKAAEEMKKLTGRLDKTINDLLSFARVSNPAWQSANPNDVVDDTLFFIRKDCRDASCSIEESLDPDMPDIPMDPKLIQQILFNLVINARHACEGMESACVLVSTSTVPTKEMPEGENPADYIEIRVDDNGTGISEDVLSSIYKPFFTTKNQGTGLGLSISRNILDAHNGLMGLRTVKDGGTTFYVWLRKRRLAT